MADWVYRDGQRLTAWMAYQIARLDAVMYAMFGVHVIVSSGLRTYAEQVRIFLDRYVTAGNVNGRRVYDTRVWNGVRYYRISSAGTVAVPGTSNHEVQGNDGAADLRDAGSDPGIASGYNTRANWLRAHAHEFGMVPEGYNFREPWHYKFIDIFRTPPATPSGSGGGSTPHEEIETESEEDEMKDRYIFYKRADGVQMNAIYNTMSGFFQEFESNKGDYNTKRAQGHDIEVTQGVSASDYASIKDACAAVRTGTIGRG